MSTAFILIFGYLFFGILAVILNIESYVRLWPRLNHKVKWGLSLAERAQLPKRTLDRTRLLTLAILLGLNVLIWPAFALVIED